METRRSRKIKSKAKAKAKPIIIVSCDEVEKGQEEDLNQTGYLRGTDCDLVSAVAQSPCDSHVIVLGDSQNSETTSQLETARNAYLEHNDFNTESTSQAKTKSNLPLLARRRCRGNVFCYGKDSSVESNMIKISSKMIQKSGIAVRGQGSGNEDRNLAMTLDVTSEQLLQREHEIYKGDDKLEVFLLSDSDGEMDEEAYNEGKAMKFKKPRKASFHASGTPDKVILPVRSRKRKRRKKKIGKFHCTVCLKSFGKTEVARHPLLNVCVCYPCKSIYKMAAFEKDEDGFEGLCRWCGFGGDLFCCEKCDKVFCQNCITHDFGERELLRILDSDSWLCFVCDATSLKPLVVRLLKAREEIYRSRFDLIN